jgi:transposase
VLSSVQMAAGGRDRERIGALCPLVRVVPGACGDPTGDREPHLIPFSSVLSSRRARARCSCDPRDSVETAMAPRKQQSARSTPTLPPQLAAVHLYAAGIDMGAENHWVAGPPRDDPQPVRRCGADTADLEALADWLAPWGLTTMALASPGVAWIPRFALLATRGVAVHGIDPPQVQQSKGRPKSDRRDCQGWQRLPTLGLLAAACRPDDQVWGLRSALRQRALLLPSAAQPIQHRQQALSLLHLPLQPVVRAMPGVPGLTRSRAILAGARAPHTRAQRRASRGTQETAPITRALPGHGRDEQRCALAQAVARSDGSQQHIPACDHHSDVSLQTCAARSAGQPLPPAPRPRQHGRHPPAFAVRLPLPRMTGVDLTQSEGLDETTAWSVRSAMGCDIRRWPTGKPCTAWWGRCPHHRVSGGKGLSRRTNPCANRAATALRLAAAGLPHSQSAFGACFRRMQARLGAPKAITATAHKLARLISRMLKHGAASVRQGMDAYAQQSRDRAVQH